MSNDVLQYFLVSSFQPERKERGGPYLCVHMRRKDYVYARKEQIPTVIGAGEQVRAKCESLGLKAVFVSTDAHQEEFMEFKSAVGKDIQVEKFNPPPEVLYQYKDGGIAIIDQSICSHAR